MTNLEDAVPAGLPAVPPAGPRARVSWFWPDVFVPFVATRLMLLLVVWLAFYRRLTAGASAASLSPGYLHGRHFWLDMWAHWDSYHYLDIAANGYHYDPARNIYDIAFFPLYPLCIRAVAAVLGHGPERLALAGVLVSNAALLLALFFLSALIRKDHAPETAARAVWYLLVFPVTFFLSAVYSDSLFLACVLGSFFYARSGRWGAAGVLGLLAALCRPPGVLLLLPMAWDYLAQRRDRWCEVRPDVLALALVPAGLAAYMAFLWVRFGDPLLFVHVQTHWGRSGGLLHTLWDAFFGPSDAAGGSHSLLDTVFLVFYVVLVVLSWRWRPRSYALFASLYFLSALGSGQVISLIRYGMSFFVIFLLLALAGRSPAFDRAYMAIASGLAALFAVFFALGYWVA